MSNVPEVTYVIDLETGRILTLDESKREATYIDLKGLPSIPNYLDKLKNVLIELQDSPHFVVEDLGVKEIDGREAVGFLAKHPKAEITLWADSHSGLPVRIEQVQGQLRVICRNLEFNVPLDEYPRRCIAQIEGWKEQRDELVNNRQLSHSRTGEYCSYIMEAMETDTPFRFGGNVLNNGLITNLPRKACVEVTCMADRNGVQGCYVGDLPEQCAALNRTNINVQLLTVEAALTRRRDKIYQAAMMDPHTASDLPLDQITDLCDDLIEAHGDYLPEYT